MIKGQADYLSYLLRLRRTRSTGQTVWRASLESPHTGERLSFASLEALFDFLRQQTDAASHSGDGEAFRRTTEDDRTGLN